MDGLLNKGFTLLELLISITIVGVILVIIMGAFRIGVRAWEAGEQDIESNQRQQVVLSLLKQQLSSVCIHRIETQDNAPFYFRGDANSLECISDISIIPGNNPGRVYVHYRLRDAFGDETKTLEIFEKKIVGASLENGFETDGAAFHELLSGMHNIEFKYVKEITTEALEWQEAWHPDKAHPVPAAVQLQFRKNQTSDPVTMVARIPAEREAKL